MTLYITCASFEERCLALVEQLHEARLDERLLLIDFLGYENVSPYQYYRSRMIRQLAKKRYNLATLNAAIARPLEALQQIEAMVQESAPSEVIVDISSMPRNYLFCICSLLDTLGLPARIRYYRPRVYGSELSRGVRSLQVIPGFEGDIIPSGEMVLGIILGFEGYKALHAWESVGPNRTIAFLGEPPYQPEFLETSKTKNKELLYETPQVSVVSMHTHAVRTARDQLQQVYDRMIGSRQPVSFVLCPLGTKPQSLAAFAFAHRNRQVAVAYVSSLTYYPEDYSRGWDDNYLEISLVDLLTE
jgi:hypothetical protein